MVDFHGNAIVLSGETGTKLKSQTIGKYYPRWWEITSGGASKGFDFTTTIIEMNAGSGENYIKESDETIFGSSGHALDLKATNPNTSQLNIILVEEDQQCFNKLKDVIKEHWPNLEYSLSLTDSKKDVFLLQDPSEIFNIIDQLNLGNALFFFDPLLGTPWPEIEQIAKKRIETYYQTGTEFIVFLFTSDWFLGRGTLSSLPETTNETNWNSGETNTVAKVDELLGDENWRPHILQSSEIDKKMQLMVSLYQKRLHRWFRYVLPLPFAPKPNQLYHLFMCSNYEEGIDITKGFYSRFTQNPRYAPNNRNAYSKFKWLHPEMIRRGSVRSEEWKILWDIIKNHDEGLCDRKCKSFIQNPFFDSSIDKYLEWLRSKGYLKTIEPLSNAWIDCPQLYRLDWNFVEETLGIPVPPKLTPFSGEKTTPESVLSPDTLDYWFN